MDLIGRTELLIAAPPERLWALLADVAQWKAWMPGVRWAVRERAFGPGGYVTIKPERGRQTAFHIEQADAPRVLALGMTFGPLARLRRMWRLEAEGAGTRITHEVEVAGPLRAQLVAATAMRLHAESPALLEALSSRA